MTPAPDPNDLAELVGQIADEFTDRVHRGETPDVEEYARRHPSLAGVLREVLPAVRALGGLPAPTFRRGTPAPLPTTIGPYEVLGPLGQGGMGVVYKARDPRLGRVVAVKVSHDDEGDRERFRIEGRAAARLRHPHIVSVYEVGEHEGRPYLALEYVAGGTLAAHLRRHRPTPAQAVALVEPVAEAVHAAHVAGIVHRDLKPANILLNVECGTRNAELKTEEASAARPSSHSAFRVPHSASVPKVTDFGLAKWLGGAVDDRTKTGAIVGTPGYMAPEQTGAGGRAVGPAADVYALGAVLYECLTGRPPFAGDSPFEVLEQVRTAEPVPPRRLDPLIPRDLETVCLKCLRKAPHERYATAAELADDLRRFREGRPVLARPLGRAARAWRLCKRNPVVAGLTAAVILLGVAGLVTSTALWWQAEQNLTLAVQRERDLDAALTLAEQRGDQERTNFAWAQEAVDEMLSRVGEDLEDVPHASLARRQVLEKALALQQRFLAHRSADPRVRLEVARAHRRVAMIHRLLGDPAEARAAAEAGRAGIRAADTRDAASDAEEAWITSVLGSAMYHQMAYADAAREQQAAGALYERVLRDRPDDTGLRIQAADTAQQLGLSLTRARRYPEADAAYRVALRHIGELPGDHPETRYMAARTHNRLGTLLRSWGKLRDADRAFDEAERTAVPLAAEFPDRRDYRQELAGILFNHGNLLVTAGRAGAERALALYGRAQEQFRGLSGDYRYNPDYRSSQADCLFGRAQAQAVLGRIEDSRADYEAAVRGYEALQSDFPADHRYREGELRARLNLFDQLIRLREHAAAGVCADRLDRLAAGLRAALPTNSDPVYLQGRVAGKRAFLRDALGETEKAVPLHEASIALLRKALAMAPESDRYRTSLLNGHRHLADVFGKLGRRSDLRRVADDCVKDFPAEWVAHCRSAEMLCRAASLAPHDRPFAAEACEKAVERLTAAYELCRKADRVPSFANAVRANKELAPLRDHARFKAILAELPPPKPKSRSSPD